MNALTRCVQVCEDGSTNWLEGAMLIIAYAIICIAYYFG